MEGTLEPWSAGRATRVDYPLILRHLPTAYVIMDPSLHIVEANDAYLALLGRNREDTVGRYIFEAFPPDPATVDEDGVSELERAYARTRDSGVTEVLPLVCYPIVDPDSGAPVDRWWSLISSAVRDETGRTQYVMERVEDITDYVQDRRLHLPEDRVDGVEATLYLRLQQVQAAHEARDVSERRITRLAEIALKLTAAETIDDVERIVVRDGVSILGADGGAVVSPADDGGWRVTGSPQFADTGGRDWDLVPYDSPLPGCHTARTGERLMLTTLEQTLAFHPVMALVVRQAERSAFISLPLTLADRTLGALVVTWVADRTFTQDEIDLLDGFAAQCALTLDRVMAAEAERAAALAGQQMAETLQRSLLTQPELTGALQVAVRYQPAASGVQIGGDWYDAFVTRNGRTVLVVGDISGHDQDAAAAMSQIRNMLRGMAYDGDDRPNELLTRLDAAICGLQLGVLATAVLAVVEPSVNGDDTRTLRWVNAGHLPPLLRHADRSVSMLAGTGDLLLGLDPTAVRLEQSVDLHPGDTLVLYTDGLVERRVEGFEVGISTLMTVLQRSPSAGAEVFCDRMLTILDGRETEDDTALLVLTVDSSTVRHVVEDGPEVEEIELPADPRSVRDARRLTERRCQHSGLSEDLVDTAILLTSELVTNAIVHGRSNARLRVTTTPNRVEVEVGDDNDRLPVLQTHDDAALTGRGISLLELAATSWGVREEPIGKVVWFALEAV